MAQAVARDTVEAALRGVQDPELHHSIMELGMIREIEIESDGVVCISVVPTSVHCPHAAEIVSRIERAVGALAGVSRVEVAWGDETL